MKHGLVYLLLAMSMACSCVNADKAYVRKAVRLMDKSGLFAEGPEWDAARAEALSAAPQTPDEAKDIVRKALKVAGGKHSFIKVSENVVEDANSEWKMPTVSFEEDGIAVIALPAFSGPAGEGVRYASTVLEALPDTLPGVVIDLRGNTGGNMYPMISAVHRFLPDDDILRFRTRKRTNWISLRFVLQGTGVAAKAPVDCRVAILTDDMTASSGEAVLLTFRGLENVRTFGAPTAGYASANTTFPMPDGSQLVLTTGCDVARTGEVFCDDPIAPDVLTDSPMKDALAWLRGL
jgi:C-terminal processing protease CtpA/Prc